MTALVRPLPEDLTLDGGGHSGPEDGYCVMELVAYVAGESWSDHPECCCPVIAAFLRSWNDGIKDDETRTRLLAPLVPRLVGSRSTTAVEERRAYMALDWLVREQAAVALEQVPALVSYAKSLRDLPEITAATVGDAVEPICAAWDAARAAARAAAWAAAWAAAGDAAGERLAPLVADAQQSALLLVDRMLAVTDDA